MSEYNKTELNLRKDQKVKKRGGGVKLCRNIIKLS